MSTYTQEGGLFKIDTPLGSDVLLLRGFKGAEAISRLFRFELDLLSENSSIAFPDIIGKNVTISLKQPDGSYRYLNGIISRFAQHATEEQFTAYSAEMVPWLWLLTRNLNCRGFLNKSIPDIITKVFSDLDFNDFTNSLQDSYDPQDYCVQYRESDFNFVSRLMEQYGIFYFFKHEQGKHTLVMADSPTAHISCPGQSSARYVTVAGGPQEDVITGWHIEQELRAGKYRHTHYNFETPSTSLMSSEPTVYEVGGNSKLEIYDYFGQHLTKSAGQAMAKIRMQEEEAQHLVAHGTSQCRMLVSGYKFTLEEHPRKDMNTDYVLTEIQHTAVTDAFPSSGNPEGESYSNTFACIPLSVPFRPLRVTPQAALHSLAVAVVAGPGGEEIATEEFGRVKVTYPWDGDGTGTYWARVSQVWAGNGWGAWFLPRIGQEVLVDFEEGDPRHPYIVGCVYNATDKQPWPLPDKQNISGFRSHSTKGGGDHDANVLTFDDTMGSECFYMRAQKDMTRHVENNDSIWVDNNQNIYVHNLRQVIVDKGNETIILHNGDRNIKIDIGSQTTEAMQSITLKVGQSSIVLDQTGVTIKGMKIQIQGQISAQMQALMTEVDGDMTLTLQGGVTNIN
jgi:type VI secretion system secreted protein VgrG